ncbi:MAG: Holliday junction branch migration protein RuvA [Holosporales bacterium]|jgi:Holliday junction DNA helicase RuvA|nr:Holliday junction branch migration protein RuvA [Holosporales bacterium]
MIGKLKGIIDSINVEDGSVIVDTNGVGYIVLLPINFLSGLNSGDFVDLYIYHVIKQETQYLCGFKNRNEVRIFKTLLDVPGIGVKSSLSVMSTLSPQELALAVAMQDSEILCKASGIGKKTSARILLELKDKTAIVNLNDDTLLRNEANPNVNDAMLGLVSLGYQKNVVIKAIKKVSEELGKNASVNDLIISCLRNIS